MIIAIAGHRGYLGSRFMEAFIDARFIRLERTQLYGEPEELGKAIGGADLVVNFAGASIARRWTPKNRRKIMESRHRVNANLVEAVNLTKKKPGMFISSSAIGIYDQKGVHTERDHRTGDGFMAQVVKKWEEPLEGLDPSVKKVILRTAVVLGNGGGALPRLRRSAKLGLAGIPGSGKQPFSFVHIQDLLDAVRFVVDREMEGIIHISSPEPVDYEKFTKTLGRLLGSLLVVRVPVLFMWVGLGKAHVIVTEGQHVLPERLVEEGFVFRYPGIESALHNLLASS